MPCRGRDTALSTQRPTCLCQEFTGGVAGTSVYGGASSGPDAGMAPACLSQKARRDILFCSREARRKKKAI